jgi:hypothetical protein
MMRESLQLLYLTGEAFQSGAFESIDTKVRVMPLSEKKYGTNTAQALYGCVCERPVDHKIL